MRAVLILGMAWLAACGAQVDAAPEHPGAIRGLVLQDGRPVRADLVARRYADVSAMGRWSLRMPRYEDPPAPAKTVLRSAASDAQGRFTLMNLPPGVYAVSATGVEHGVAEQVVVLADKGMQCEATLRLAPGTAVAGKLVWSDGTPAVGRIQMKRVRYHGRPFSGPYDPWQRTYDMPPSGPTQSAVLGEDGSFDFGVVAQGVGYSLEAFLASGFRWTHHGGDLEKIGPLQKPGQVVRGRIVDESGAPIADATVGVGGRGVYPTRQTDADGRFELPCTYPCTLGVKAPGYERAGINLKAPGDPITLTLAAKQPATAARWTGRVLQRDGSPAPGAHVVVLGSPRLVHGQAHKVIADGAGHFVVEGLTFEPKSVLIRGGGWASVGLADKRPLPWKAPAEPVAGKAWRLTVEPTKTLRGRVLLEGQPLAGAQVRALGVHRDRHREIYDAISGPTVVATRTDGTFTIHDAVPGFVYGVVVRYPGLADKSAGPFPVDAPSEPVEVTMTPARWLDVRVVDAEDGRPLENAWVSASNNERRFVDRATSTRTNKDGWARLGSAGRGAARRVLRARRVRPRVRSCCRLLDRCRQASFLRPAPAARTRDQRQAVADAHCSAACRAGHRATRRPDVGRLGTPRRGREVRDPGAAPRHVPRRRPGMEPQAVRGPGRRRWDDRSRDRPHTRCEEELDDAARGGRRTRRAGPSPGPRSSSCASSSACAFQSSTVGCECR